MKILYNGRLNAANSMINPSNVNGIGDPFVLYDDGVYYMYATSTGTGFRVWKSSTMRHWEYIGLALNKSPDSWGVIKYWAPEVYRYNGKYYMVYSAENAAGIHALGAAVSDTPAGPFVNLGEKPLLSFDYSVIDAHVFFADDGRTYLYYSKDCSTNVVNGIHESHIYGVALSNDFSAVIGEPVLLLTPSQSWEFRPTDKTRWNEGPFVFERNGVYYLMYSANLYSSARYAVGYATADKPLGPYSKYEKNPILQGDGSTTSGSGHNSLTVSPDGSEIWIVYHTHTYVEQPSGNRQACADRLIVREDGSLYANGPSLVSQPLPSGCSGLADVSASLSADIHGAFSGGSAAVLLDQVFFGSSAETCVLDADAYLSFTPKEPINLAQVWVYPGKDSLLVPTSFDLVINDSYKIENVRFTEKPGEPAVAIVSGLPEGVRVNSFKVHFNTEDSAEKIEISEVIAIAVQ